LPWLRLLPGHACRGDSRVASAVCALLDTEPAAILFPPASDGRSQGLLATPAALGAIARL